MNTPKGARLPPIRPESVGGVLAALLATTGLLGIALLLNWRATGRTLPRGVLDVNATLGFGTGFGASPLVSLMAIQTLFAGTIALACALALWIFRRAPEPAPNRQLAWLLLASAALLLDRTAPVFAAMAGIEPRVLRAPLRALDTALVIYVLIGLARFIVLFPRPVDTDSVETLYLERRPIARWLGPKGPRLPVHVLSAWHQGLLSGRIAWIALLPGLLWVVSEVADGQGWRTYWNFALGFSAFIAIVIYFAFGLPFALASTRHWRRFGNDDERRRVRLLHAVWLGLLVALALSVVALFAAGQLAPPAPKSMPMPGTRPDAAEIGVLLVFVVVWSFWSMFPVIAAIATALAVLSSGSLDARLVFRRISAWSLLSLFTTLLFVVVERFVAVRLAEWLGLASGDGAIVAAAIVATTFVPLRRWVGRGIDQLAARIIPLQELARGSRVTRAVAFVDLSGYTALSERDEPQAILQSAALARLASTEAARHSGVLIKGLGDAVLLSFPDVDGAVGAVRQVHASFPSQCAVLGVEPLALHSSVHVGEVVQAHDGDLFGQTVNIAARLVHIAQQGQLVLSADARAQWSDGGRAAPLGAHTVRNVAEPLECYAA